MRSLSFIDHLILVFCILLFGGASFLLYDDSLIFPLEESYSSQQELGTVVITKNDVRRKSSFEFTFNSLKKNSKLFSGDNIFTGKNSFMSLKLLDGTEMSIAENTLIVLAKTSTDLNLDLKFGEVAKVQGGSGKIFVSQGEFKSEVKGSKDTVLRIAAAKGKAATVRVLSGKVDIKKKTGEVETLTSGTMAPVLTQIVIPQPLFPANKSVLYTDANFILTESGAEQSYNFKSGLKFIWDQVPAHAITFELSKDNKFKNLLVSQDVSDEIFWLSKPPDAGLYYWRLVSGSRSSQVFRFEITTKKEIKLLQPTNQSVQWQSLNQRNQFFLWEKIQGANWYDFQIATDPEFFNTIFHTKTQNHKLEWQTVPAFGKFFWQVHGLWTARSSHFMASSSVGEFEIRENRPPNLIAPALDSTLILSDYQVIPPHQPLLRPSNTQELSKGFLFTWDPSEFENTVLEISKDKSFQNPVLTHSTNTGSFLLTEIKPGNYFWRVSGQDPRHQKNLISSIYSFKVLMDYEKQPVPAPKISDFHKKIELRPLSRTPSSMVSGFEPYDLSGQNKPYLDWIATSDVNKYEITISSDKQKKNIVHQNQIHGTTYQWKNIKPGDYFWFVKSVATDTTKESPEVGGTLKVTVSPPQLQPIAAREEKVLSEEEMKAPLPSLALNWSETVLTDEYLVEIDKNRHFVNPQKHRVNKNFLNYQPPKMGVYYWRVTALNKNGQIISAPSFFEKIILNRSLGLYTPEGLLPKNNSEMIFLSDKASHVILSWQKINGAHFYEFELSPDKNFKKIIYKGKTKTTKEYLPIKLPSGPAFWRVRAVNRTYKSEWSKTMYFVVSYKE